MREVAFRGSRRRQMRSNAIVYACGLIFTLPKNRMSLLLFTGENEPHFFRREGLFVVVVLGQERVVMTTTILYYEDRYHYHDQCNWRCCYWGSSSITATDDGSGLIVSSGYQLVELVNSSEGRYHICIFAKQ